MKFNICFHKPHSGEHLDWGIVNSSLSGLTITSQLPPLRVFTVEVDSANDVKHLANNVNIKYIVPSVMVSQEAAFSVPISPTERYDKQWYIFHVGAHFCKGITQGDPSVVVAIIDSGLNPASGSFTGKQIIGYSTTNADPWNQEPMHYHGTAIASIIASNDAADSGMCGIAPSITLMPVRVTVGDSTEVADTELAEALLIAAAHGANIVNLSYGSPDHSNPVADAINFLFQEGVLTVHSAGNNGATDGAPSFPLSSNILVVGGIMNSNARVPTSSYGKGINIVAPGENIVADMIAGYGYVSGTSFAAPIVAGVAALLLSEDPSLSPGQIINILTATAGNILPDFIGTETVDTGDGQLWDSPYGQSVGCLNAYRALLTVIASKPGNENVSFPYILVQGENVTYSKNGASLDVTVSGAVHSEVGVVGQSSVVACVQNDNYIYRGSKYYSVPYIKIEAGTPVSVVSE